MCSVFVPPSPIVFVVYSDCLVKNQSLCQLRFVVDLLKKEVCFPYFPILVDLPTSTSNLHILKTTKPKRFLYSVIFPCSAIFPVFFSFFEAYIFCCIHSFTAPLSPKKRFVFLIFPF
jgi:hypothetical protein